MRDYDTIIIELEQNMKAVSKLVKPYQRDNMVTYYNKAIECLNELSDIIEGLQDEVQNLEYECQTKDDVTDVLKLTISDLEDEIDELNTLVEVKDDTIEFLNHAIKDYENNYPEFSYYRHDHPEFDWVGCEYWDGYDDGK